MNAKMKENLIGVGIAITLVGGLLTWGVSHFMGITMVRAEEIQPIVTNAPIQVEAHKKPTFEPYSKEGHAISAIEGYHELFNEKVGYGNIKDFSWWSFAFRE